MLPAFERAAEIGDLRESPKTRWLAKLLIDAEEDRYVWDCSSGGCGGQYGPRRS